jgi:hypothetical protein
MRGLIGFFDEAVIDQLEHHDVPRAHLVELAVATLHAVLGAAAALDPTLDLPQT